MKYIFFLLLFFSGIAAAQTKTKVNMGSKNTIVMFADGLGADSVLMYPTGCGAPGNITRYTTAQNKSAFYHDSCSGLSYYYNIKTDEWVSIVSPGVINSNPVYIVQDSLNAQPVSPDDSTYWLTAGTPTGTDWTGHPNAIAFYNGTVWSFPAISTGDNAFTLDTYVWHQYNGSTWPISTGYVLINGGNPQPVIVGSTVAQNVSLIYNKSERIKLVNGGTNFTQLTGTNYGVMQLGSNGRATRTEPASTTDTAANKPVGIASDGTLVKLSYWPGSGGGSQTWQQTLTTGSTLTGNNTIDATGFGYTHNGARFTINLTDSMLIGVNKFSVASLDSLNLRGNLLYGKAARTQIGATSLASFIVNTGTGDSLGIRIQNGQFYVPGLATATTANVMYYDATTKAMTYGATPSSNLVVGTSTITSGTNTRILYDNAGVLGEYLVTGTGTTAMLNTSPTINTKLTITGGTLTDGANALALTATMPTTITATNSAINYQLTSAGSSSFAQRGVTLDLLAGYTGNAGTVGVVASNAVAGTGANLFGNITNRGMLATASATTSGYNVGISGEAQGGNVSVGAQGLAVTNKNSATNIGVFGFANNTGSSPIVIGGYFGLGTSDPTFTSLSAALVADNTGANSNPVFLGKGSASTFTLASTGYPFSPNYYGGTAVGSSINFIPTTGVGTSSSQSINFKVGNNGAITAGGFVNNGQFTLTPGTLTDLTPGFTYTATMPTVMTGTNNAVNFQITTAGSSAQVTRGVNIDLLAGYTGSGATNTLRFSNAVAGTGGALVVGTGNKALHATTTATTTGYNMGTFGNAQGGNLSVGAVGTAITDKNSATNIGVAGFARNTGSSPIQIGGYFSLNASDPTFTGASAALVADNAGESSPIQLWRDGGAIVGTFADGGLLRVGDATAPSGAWVTLAAGTTSNAPLQFVTGTLNTTATAGRLEYGTPQLFFTNGGAIRQEIPQIQQSRVSAQFDKANTTLADVTGLTASVAAGRKYRFEADLYTTSNVAGGVKVAVGGTATATAIIYEGLTYNAGAVTQSRATALATSVGAVTAVTAAYIHVVGTITVNAAGTLTIQFAENTAVNTSSVLVGSTFVVTEMN